MKSQITNSKIQGNSKLQIPKSKPICNLALGIYGFLVIWCLGFGIFLVPAVYAETPAEVQQLITERERQIAELEAQIAQYWKSVDEKRTAASSVQNEISILQDKIKQSELEIRSLVLTLQKLGYELTQTEGEIQETNEKIGHLKGRIALSLRLLQGQESAPMLVKLASAERLSQVFDTIAELQQFHDSLRGMLGDLKDAKGELESDREEIIENKSTQERLKRIEESQREIAARSRARQAQFLEKIEKEKSKLIGTIEGKKRDLQKIREQITYLGQVGVSVEEAVRFGELAAIRTGVRASFLIAVLEVESRLGINVGKGNWREDMHSRDHEAFKTITAKLGLNPDTTPVSKAPSYGWGGAMGPAQFLPNTWLAYEAEVARLTGHNPPSPWNIEDAFTAAALKLARGGAAEKTRAGEIRAAKAYISGSGNCTKSICNRYANLVQEKADDIEAELSKNGRT